MNDVQYNQSDIVLQKENRFFNEHGSSDQMVKSLIDYLKRQNESHKFIAKTVDRIGYPYWDKALSIKQDTKANFNRTNSLSTNEIGVSSGAASTVVYIPFVRDEDKQVNAALVFLTNPTDTSFQYVCDWQYRTRQHEEISQNGLAAENNTESTAESHAWFFMMLDKHTLGHKTFRIKDRNLFPKAGKGEKRVSFHVSPANQKTKPAYYVGSCETTVYCGTPEWGGCQPECDWTNCAGSAGTCYMRYSCDVRWINPWNGNGGGGGGGSGGGSSGGGGSNNGGNQNNLPPDCSDPANKHSGGCEEGWEPTPPPVNPQPITPCELAKAAAANMNVIFASAKIDEKLSTVSNLATETSEKGFAVIEKFSINPQNVTDTTISGYRTTSISTGTDSSIVIPASWSNLEALVATLHTHPSKGYAAQSAKDVYELIANQSGDLRYQGNFVAAANGSKYALTVTDRIQAAAFYNTMSQNLEGSKWKEDSEIGKVFVKAQKYFEDKFKGDVNQINLAYEMAMATVLTKFDTGITLHRQNSQNKFEPIRIKMEIIPRQGMFKPEKTIYTQDCL